MTTAFGWKSPIAWNTIANWRQDTLHEARMIRIPRPRPTHALLAMIALAVLGASLGWRLAGGTPPAAAGPGAGAAAAVAPAAPVATPQPDAETRPGNYVGIRTRPFEVARESASHQWTAEDGRSPEAILELAHNDRELMRLLDENDRIQRRQLVYRTVTAADMVRSALAGGAPVRKLVLPGLDGREFEVEIDRADLAPAGQSGTFTGHLAGRPRSMVTLAFKGGREAFSVSSPEDALYLQADPREPGEVIVKSIDPATYVKGQCGTCDPVHGLTHAQ